MLNHPREVSDATPAPRRPPAPHARVVQTAAGPAIEPILDGTASVEDFHAAFLAALATTEQIVAEALFQQTVNAVHPDPKRPIEAATANLVLALLHRIAPRDELETMLVCQMIVAHVATMDGARRAFHVEQTAGGRAVYLNLARRLMTTFTLQMDALNRHRGKGTMQKIVIERVLVAPGAQAVVGTVSNGGRGDGA
jgi:hypothetical protein